MVHAARSSILAANYWLNNYEEVIWIIGDARSGTTWVSNLINYGGRYRQMFEPFHPQRIGEMAFLQPHQYVGPDDSNIQLEVIASNVFSGRFLHPRVDRSNRRLRYKGLLIKDIYANLFAYWLSCRFPAVKVVLLVRNPFAVALSKYHRKHWPWPDSPVDLLGQRKLYEDFLQPFEGLIREVSNQGDYIQRHVLIWSIINLVPILQFPSDGLHVLFYEDVAVDPNHELSEMLNYVRPDDPRRQVKLPQETVNRPSRVTSRESTDFANAVPVSSWKDELTASQIDSGLTILKTFGLDELYGEDSMPDRSALQRIH
jgi:hypothetical protein